MPKNWGTSVQRQRYYGQSAQNLPTSGNNLQEDLHHDGSAIMYKGRTDITRRGGTWGIQDDKMDEGDTDDHNDGHDEGSPLRETTKLPPPPPRFTRGY